MADKIEDDVPCEECEEKIGRTINCDTCMYWRIANNVQKPKEVTLIQWNQEDLRTDLVGFVLVTSYKAV